MDDMGTADPEAHLGIWMHSEDLKMERIALEKKLIRLQERVSYLWARCAIIYVHDYINSLR